ncbi:hypothetical protein E2C01_079417 [Portunus trituberculatus]|uniref:Uncharacterized protein n=1 Tax=Portunus trituberculatus TaxID=210409 RepID=A0A5B7ILG6_PORTR|nr:hypothetical protein [Portunus trituberculatus]
MLKDTNSYLPYPFPPLPLSSLPIPLPFHLVPSHPFLTLPARHTTTAILNTTAHIPPSDAGGERHLHYYVNTHFSTTRCLRGSKERATEVVGIVVLRSSHPPALPHALPPTQCLPAPPSPFKPSQAKQHQRTSPQK